jgi:uncharacterized protein (TIGR02996 family)
VTIPPEFLRPILELPFEDAPRLVLADYLDERGDLRGEYIRLQIEAEREKQSGEDMTPERSARIRLLFDRLVARQEFDVGLPPGTPYYRSHPLTDTVEWVGDHYTVRLTTRCGFVERIELPLAEFLRHGPALAYPLLGVRLTDRPAHRLGEAGYCHYIGSFPELPPAVWGPLYHGPVPRVFPSAGAADRKLGQLLVDYARNLAGLPALDWSLDTNPVVAG